MSAAPMSDPFALFDLEPSFALDVKALEERFFALNRELHPDRFATAPAAQRVAALSKSRALNDAYQLLRKPVPRAEYLLTRAGGAIGDNERLSPVFLEEILERREALAEARVAGRLDEVNRLGAEMRAQRAAVLAELAPLFARLAAAGAHADPVPERALAVDRIKHTLISLRYLDRYLEECDAALDADPEIEGA
jgi:molecular chaperone HscB